MTTATYNILIYFIHLLLTIPLVYKECSKFIISLMLLSNTSSKVEFIIKNYYITDYLNRD